MHMTPSVRWGELTAEELNEATKTNALVILPLGCTEQHAAHLPVDTDTYQVDRLTTEGGRKAAERYGVGVVVLPPVPYGPAAEHYGYPGTISLPSSVYLQVIRYVLWSAIELGFRRLAVVSGCGGHFVVPGAIWDLKVEARRAGYDVTLRSLRIDHDWRRLKEKYFPRSDSGHAAVMETALCLASREHLVRKDKMRAPILHMFSERYHEGGEAFLFREVTDTGGLGDPTPATAEGGRAIWEEMTDAFATKLKSLEDQDRQLNRL